VLCTLRKPIPFYKKPVASVFLQQRKNNGKTPAAVAAAGVSAKGFGKKRGRKEDLRSLKGAAHGFRSLSVIRVHFGFEHPITET